MKAVVNNKHLIITAACILLSLTGFCASAFDVPEKSQILPGYDMSSVRHRLSTRPLEPIEGLWSFPDERMVLAIEHIASDNHGLYRLTVVDAEDSSTDFGCVIGYLEDSPDSRKLTLWLYSRIKGDGLPESPAKCVAEIDADNRKIQIERTRLHMYFSANIMQFLPSVFNGIRIYPRIRRAKTSTGLIKIFPKDGDDANPVYF